MRIAVAPSHWVGPHQIRPSRWTAAIRRSVVGPSTARTSTWLSTTSFRIVRPPAAQPVGDHGGARRRPAARARRRPTGRACAARPTPRSGGPAARLRRVVHRLEPRLGRQVAGDRGERAAQRTRSLHERDAAVVRDVQPLVSVGGPRVGAGQTARPGGLGSGRRAPTARTRRRRATSRRGRATQSAISSNGSNAPVFTSPACAQHSTGPSPGRGRATRPRSRPWSSAGTTITRSRPSPTRPSDLRNVECAFAPMTTWIGGRPEQSVALHVPAARGQQRVARGGEAGGVGDRRAGHERHVGVGRRTRTARSASDA